MRRAGLTTPMVWVDVEPVPDFEWSGDLVANAAVVQGAARGYADAGYRVGVYSTPLLWSHGRGRPGARPARVAGRGADLARGGDSTGAGRDWSIQRGRAVLGQWVEQGRDQNITCPGISADLGRWFQQY